MNALIQDIALSILAAWLLGLLAHLARQPAILAYLVGGFILGPFGLKWVQSQESIATISELGLIFMLFMIGLEIDLKKVLGASRAILVTAGVQILGGCLIGVLFFMLIGLPMRVGHWDALYLGVAAAMSSTVIIVKVLYDKRELDTLPGRITLGILVLQDLFAVVFLAVQESLDDLRLDFVLLSVGRVTTLVAASFLVSRFVLPTLFHRVARLPELLLVGALAWCFAVVEFAEYLDLSREMGALVAGVSLSTFPYALDVKAKVTTLRDFFITLFFVALGMKIPVPSADVVALGSILAVFVVASRIVTTFTPLYLTGNGLRASLLPALNLCQISEFSLVIIQLGAIAGFITVQTESATSLAFAILAVLSTIAMTNSDPIVRGIITALKRIGLRDLDHGQAVEVADGAAHGRILLLGFFRAASSLLGEFERKNPALVHQVSVVDFNPLVYRTLKARGVKVLYGDISHTDTLAHAGVEGAEIVVSSVPDALLKGTTNEKLVRLVRGLNPKAKIIATADLLEDAELLYRAGADYVVVARLAEASELIDVIKAVEDGLLDDRRAKADARLHQRQEVLP
jgi:Kef-type K+ transport system membrane component KefB